MKAARNAYPVKARFGPRWMLGACLLFALIIPAAGRAADNQRSFVVDGATISFTMGGVWSGSYQIEGTVSGASAGWKLLATFPGAQKISTAWGVASPLYDGSGMIHNNSWSAANGSFTLGVDGSPAGVLPVSITFNGVSSGGTTSNHPPVAANDTAAVAYGGSATIDVLANDSDPDGDTLTIASLGVPAHGGATLGGGKARYQAASGFSGADAFTYVVSDGKGGSANATVNVTVAAPAANVAPTLSFLAPAAGQVITQTTLSPVAVSISAADSDGTVAATSVTVDGKTFNGSSASWTPSAFGSYAITATATDDDGATTTATINVTIKEQTQTASQKSFTVGDVTVVFTLGPVWGTDYQLTGTVSGAKSGWTMSVGFPNAQKITAAWGVASSSSGNMVGNNSWSPANGAFTMGVSGAPGGALPDSITFNGQGGGGEPAANQAPTITFDSPSDGAVITQTELAPVTITVTANDPDGEIASVAIAVDGHSFATASASWTPSAFGSHVITATVTDDEGATATATRSVLIKQAVAGSTLVKDWPGYIAMGAVTLTEEAAHLDRPVDAIFKYDGDGGNGDRGRIVYPLYAKRTAALANSLSSKYGMPVMPVMVVYTAEMSGGTNFEDLQSDDNMTMHFVNLINTCRTLQANQRGSIVLNPDLLGMVQQNRLWSQIDAQPLHVMAALNRAIRCATGKHSYNGQELDALEIFAAMRSASGVYSDWDVKTPWENYIQNSVLPLCSENAVDGVPTFTNDFKGWLQATNYVIRSFAPDITFGWQENLWSNGSALWVHYNYTSEQVHDLIAAPTVKLWSDLGVYSGPYKPDFIVFDRYEMDCVTGQWLFNANDWESVLHYAKHVNEGLGGVPVMLWQIPGGHLQAVGGVDPRELHGDTAPDYFFGDPDLASDLSNVKSYIPQSSLDYLTKDGHDWATGNMAKALDANVFSILWGGGNTTSVGRFPSDDGGWLSGKVNQYYQNPTVLP